MSFTKIKGSGWCDQCKCEQPAFLTRLVQHGDVKEVQGVCAVCEHPVRREIAAPASLPSTREIVAEKPKPSVIEEASVETQQALRMHKYTKSPTPDKNRPTLLSLLLVACCLLFIDQYFL